MLDRSLLLKFRGCPVLQRARRIAERVLANSLQPSILNRDAAWLPLYSQDARQAYRAAAAYGPWIVTTAGGVVYDAGGYGMLSFGHNPQPVMRALRKDRCMANIMAPDAAQDEFADEMAKHVGARSLVCLNSGSEANTFAMRLANVHRRRRSCVVAVKGSFHGRTEAPALASGSTLATYRQWLAGWQAPRRVRWVAPNDVADVHRVFDDTRRAGEFVECAILEPVMGEGEPALAATPEFYAAMRERVVAQDGLMIVDSVQAGLRCHGALSVCDYPGFEAQPPPDVETFAKAINAGQFPTSAVAIGERASARYRAGLYGNTMTANPRGLGVMSATLREMTADVAANIRDRGAELRDGLRNACDPRKVDAVRGVGLLVAIDLHRTLDAAAVERELRGRGLNVIRGGANAIRLTPWFRMSTDEVELVVRVVSGVLG